MKIPKSLHRYALVGLLTNGSIYLLFVALIWAGLGAPATAALCYIIGLSLSYLLHRRWSFESAASHRHDLPRFLFSYGTGFVATLVFIVILTRWMRPEIAQIINVGLTAAVIYVCLNLSSFGKTGVPRRKEQ